MSTGSGLNITVGVSSTRDVEEVLTWAHQLARQAGASLQVVHAFRYGDPVVDAYELLGRGGSDAFEAYSELVRFRLLDRLQELGGEVEMHAVVDDGEPGTVVAEYAARAGSGLIVVGSPRRGLAGQLLGSTAERVVRVAPVPVLVLRDGAPPAAPRVLLATDLSPFGVGIVQRTAETLRALSGSAAPELCALMVAPYAPLMPPPVGGRRLEEIARFELRRFLAEQDLPWAIDEQVRLGDPADEIVRAAREWKPDLLVVGTHAKRGLERVLLGSVAEGVLRRTRCAVLVVPPPLQRAADTPPVGATAAQNPERDTALFGA
jgi:universal stress protein E